MAHFPTEIVTEILSRLPVKTLLRFRCVSKPWCALIDSPHFTKLHLKRSEDTKNHRSLLLGDTKQHIFTLSLYSLDVAVEVDHPLQKNCSEFGPKVKGSCHGLVLLHDWKTGDTVIWNPSTRRSHKLPNTDFQPLTNIMGYGIGYDSVNDDYKVVKMTQFNAKLVNMTRVIVKGNDIPCCEVEVYSLKLDSWKRIPDSPYWLDLYGVWSVVFASGALHWVVTQNPEARRFPFVTAVDLATEEYRRLPLPNFDDNEEFHVLLAAFEGCLCILCNYVGTRIDVWVMKDYGVGESWTKMLSVAQPKDIKSLIPFIPLAFSKDGTKVLLAQDLRKIIWFDLKCKVVETLEVRGLPQIIDPQLCVESLVPVGRGGKSNVKKQHREETKEKKPNTVGKKRDSFLSVGFKLKL